METSATLWPPASAATVVSPPRGARKASATAAQPTSPVSEARETTAGGHCGHGCLLSSLGCHRYSDGPPYCGLLRYSPGDPVGTLVHPTGVEHPLGWALVSPTIYGRIPMPQPETAAPAPIVPAAVLPAAASHSGPGSGISGQDAFLARVCSSASLFWVTPGSPHGVPAPRRGCTVGNGPLSRRVFTAAGPSAARVISGAAEPYSAPA